MRAEQLKTASGKDLDMFLCGECEKVFRQKDIAERCCAPRACAKCGIEIGAKSPWAVCTACQFLSERNKETTKAQHAVQYTLATVPDDVMLYYDERFYWSADDLMDDLQENKPIPGFWPVYAWLCESRKPQMDADRIFNDFYENLDIDHDHDPSSFVTGQDDLVRAIDVFNANQKETIWSPGTKRVLVIQESDLPPVDED